MRVLIVHPAPNFSVADVYVGWVEALKELGVRVATYNLDERLTFYETALQEIGQQDNGTFVLRKALTREQAVKLATNGILSACYQFWPDVILFVSGFFIDVELLDLIRSRGHKVVLLHTEEPYEHQRQLDLSKHADLSLLNDPTNLDAFRAIGPAEYIPHSYRPKIHHPGPAAPKLVCDFAFVGTGYASRIDFLERMDLAGLDVFLGGNWQQLDEQSPLRKYVAHDLDACLDNEQTAWVYRSARCGLNLYRREAENHQQMTGWAMGPREVEMAATGCFFLRDPRPEGDKLLSMLPTFASSEDASEQLRWWLDHPQERQHVADLARTAVADRTFNNQAARLLRLLNQ